MTNHVFIAYSRNDKDFVYRLAECLKDEGVPIWLDVWNIHPSDNWPREIEKALPESICLIVVLSDSSVESNKVQSEYLEALENHKIIVPIIYRNCKTPFLLRQYQHIDFTSREPNDKAAIEEIKNALGRCSSQEPPRIAEHGEIDPKEPLPPKGIWESLSTMILSRPKRDIYILCLIMFALLAFLFNPFSPDGITSNNSSYNNSASLDLNSNGRFLFNQGNFYEALQAFNKAIDLNQSYTAAWVNKGITLNRLNKCDDALIAYDKAIGYDSKDPIAWFNKGNTLYMMGNYKESLQAYKNATDIDPNYARSYYGKGCSLYMMEDYYNAVNDYKIAEKYGQNQTDIKMFSDAKDLAQKRLNRMDDRDDS
jgi:tetratricopeptide (TPR) repeat protein